MSPDDRNVSTAVPSADGRYLNSGIVVFSSTRKALYVNEAGQQLLQQLKRNENGQSPVPSSPGRSIIFWTKCCPYSKLAVRIVAGSSSRPNGWSWLQIDQCWSERSASQIAWTSSDH
jgi:hypothetical protein